MTFPTSTGQESLRPLSRPSPMQASGPLLSISVFERLLFESHLPASPGLVA